MTHIKITKGLDVPIKGKPAGDIQELTLSGEAFPLKRPQTISLNLTPFEEIRFKLHLKSDEMVKIGQPIAEDKATPGRMFVSPAAGRIKEIRRGLKRRLLDIVIELDEKESHQELGSFDIEQASRENLIERLMQGGVFSKIRARPFNFLANPQRTPTRIFVKAMESAPYAPPAELQVKGHEEDFQLGLNALKKLTDGKVHVVHWINTASKAFREAKNVELHTAEGPHPISHHSVHIEKIDPIRNADDYLWTLNTHDVISIGYLLRTGRYFIDRVVSVAGIGILPDRIGFYKIREGFPISALVSGRVGKGLYRLISGDVLTGTKVEIEDYLGFYDYVFCVIPENYKREFLHFFRLGTEKYSFSKAYLTGHLDNTERSYDFTTKLHGEHRFFIDSTLYDEVQPLRIPTMLLVKAVMAENYELAEQLGLLEVASEDFSLPTFVCPSKMEMTEIMNSGIKEYASQLL